MPSYRLLGGNRMRLTHLHTICDALFMRRSSSLICRSRAPLSALTLTSGWPGNGRREEPQRSLIPSGCPRHMPPKHLQTCGRRRCRGPALLKYKRLHFSSEAVELLVLFRTQRVIPHRPIVFSPASARKVCRRGNSEEQFAGLKYPSKQILMSNEGMSAITGRRSHWSLSSLLSRFLFLFSRSVQ